MELINQVLKLKEVEKFVNDGRVGKETYEHLVNDVLSTRAAAEASNGAGREKSEKARSNLLKKLKGVISLGNGRKGRRRGSSMSVISGINPAARLRGIRKTISGKEKKVEQERRVLLQDYLLRLGIGKDRKPKWRRVYVTLYEDTVEYHLKSKNGEIKNQKVIDLADDFFVNQDIKRVRLTHDENDEAAGLQEDENDDPVYGQPHLFLLSNVHEKYYFAAEDDVKKEFWVSMLATALHDLTDKKEAATSEHEHLI